MRRCVFFSLVYQSSLLLIFFRLLLSLYAALAETHTSVHVERFSRFERCKHKQSRRCRRLRLSCVQHAAESMRCERTADADAAVAVAVAVAVA